QASKTIRITSSSSIVKSNFFDIFISEISTEQKAFNRVLFNSNLVDN
ncbi:36485_t:CDS:1, partial [Gigaspora margarita]